MASCQNNTQKFTKSISLLRISSNVFNSICYSKCGNTTIISKQMNNTFIPYMIEDKWQSENSIHSDEMDQDSDHNCCYQIAQIAKANEEPLKQIHWINENKVYNLFFKWISIKIFCIKIQLDNQGISLLQSILIYMGLKLLFKFYKVF
ncbi:unnamed protein product [Paramecium pentaurelia]|uniref:Uncharacterized protein n=1 Tax=Paramecium pentaurelia TaxID=43138 RepID=A0A8S1Y2S8_9CILI|nr:unnamed protein product [Paramecium pentaurelia]